MVAVDESVLWGVAALMLLYFVSAYAVELWSVAFWVLVAIVLIYSGRAAWFQSGFLTFDSSWSWLVVFGIFILIFNSYAYMGVLMNAGMVFFAFLIAEAMKADSMMH